MHSVDRALNGGPAETTQFGLPLAFAVDTTQYLGACLALLDSAFRCKYGQVTELLLLFLNFILFY